MRLLKDVVLCENEEVRFLTDVNTYVIYVDEGVVFSFSCVPEKVVSEVCSRFEDFLDSEPSLYALERLEFASVSCIGSVTYGSVCNSFLDKIVENVVVSSFSLSDNPSCVWFHMSDHSPQLEALYSRYKEALNNAKDSIKK